MMTIMEINSLLRNNENLLLEDWLVNDYLKINKSLSFNGQ